MSFKRYKPKIRVLAIRSNELSVIFEFDVKGLNQLVKRLCYWHYRLQFLKFLGIMEPVKEITPSKFITKTSTS